MESNSMSETALNPKLTADIIISAFYGPTEDRLVDETELAYVLQRLECESESALFDNRTLLNLESSGKIVAYLSSILAASSSSASEKAAKRRSFTFMKAIALFKEGKLTSQDSRDLLDRLFVNLRLLKENHASNCIDKILDDFSPTDANSITGCAKALELLGQLTARAGAARRPYVIQKLREMVWEKSTVVMLSAALVEICETEAECEGAIRKISDNIHWTSSTDSNSAHRSGDGDHGLDDVPHTSRSQLNREYQSSPEGLDIEELPALLYQLTNLTKKCEGNSAIVRTLVVEAVADALDSLLWAAYTAEENTRLRNKLDAVLATTVHHLSLLVNKDQGVASEVVSMVKTKRLIGKRCRQANARNGHSNTYNTSSQQVEVEVGDLNPISPAKLLLCMLAAKAPRQEAKILTSLCEAVAEIHLIQEKVSSSLWHSESTWRAVVELRPGQLQAAFQVLLAGSLLVEAVAAPLVGLALSLMELQRSPPRSPWESLMTGAVSCQPRPHSLGSNTAISLLTVGSNLSSTSTTSSSTSSFAPTSSEELGSWLLVKLFCVCEHARESIARDIVTRLVMSSVSSTSFTTSSSSSAFGGGSARGSAADPFAGGSGSSGVAGASSVVATATACVSVLQRLMVQCPHGLMEVSRELQEAFASLPELHPETAGRLVFALGPLFTSCAALGDRCALALRKASFSKDGTCRQAAVSALISLLRSQLTIAESLSTRPRSSNGSRSNYNGGSSSYPVEGASLSQSSSNSSGGSRHVSTAAALALAGEEVFDLGDYLRRTSPSGLSLDEITSLLRRFLQHQASVRAALYHQLYSLQEQFPVFRPLALRLLLTHLQSLMIDDADEAYLGGGRGSARANRGISYASLLSSSGHARLDLDACIDPACCPQERISDLLMTLLAIVQDSARSSGGSHRATSGGTRARGNDSNEATVTNYGTTSSSSAISQLMEEEIGGVAEGRIPTSTATAVPGMAVPYFDYPEVDDARQCLWSIAKSLAEKPLKDFGVYDLTGTSAGLREQARMSLLKEACHAAAVCFAGLCSIMNSTGTGTDTGSGTRVRTASSTTGSAVNTNTNKIDVNMALKLLKMLVNRIEELGMLLASLAAVRRKKDAEAKNKGKNQDKGKGQGLNKGAKKPLANSTARDDDNDVNDDGDGEEVGTGGGTNSANPRIGANDDSIGPRGLHLLRCELEFDAVVLTLVHRQRSAARNSDRGDDDDDDVDGEDEGEGRGRGRGREAGTQFELQSLRTNTLMNYRDAVSFENIEFLHCYILDRAVKTLERFLSHFTAQASSSTSTSTSASTSASSSTSTSTSTSAPTCPAFSEYHSLCLDVFFLLLRDMVRQRSDEGEASVSGTNSGPNNKRRAGSGSGGSGGGGGGSSSSAAVRASMGPSLSPKQLVFRGLLGCIRVVIAHAYCSLPQSPPQSIMQSNAASTVATAPSNSVGGTSTIANAASSNSLMSHVESFVFSRVAALLDSGFTRAGLLAARPNPTTAASATAIAQTNDNSATTAISAISRINSGNSNRANFNATGTARSTPSSSQFTTSLSVPVSTEDLEASCSRIMKLVKSFVKLLINMHKSVGSRDVCPIITAILGEIVSVLPRAHRCRAAEGVLRECENRLVNPTQQLSQTLTQLFLLQCPKAIDDRLTRAIEISSFISKCAQEATQLQLERLERGETEEDGDDVDKENRDDDEDQDEDEEGDEEDGGESSGVGGKRKRGKESAKNSNRKGKGKGAKSKKSQLTGTLPGGTFTIVCGASLTATVTCFVNILDKALTETELLLRLKEKQRANLTNRSRGFGFGNGVSSSGVTGHISSDDDNDDYDDAVVVEASHGTTSAGGRGGGGSGGGSRLQSRQSLRVVEDKVYLCVQRMFEASVGLLHTSIGAATERLLALFTKLYKIQVRVTRGLVGMKIQAVPPVYRSLSEYVANAVNPRIEEFLLSIHNSPGGSSGANSTGSANGNGSILKINRQAKVVPELIFNMEQLDVQLIKLSAVVRIVDKNSITRLIKRTAARDFRIKFTDDRDENRDHNRGR